MQPRCPLFTAATPPRNNRRRRCWAMHKVLILTAGFGNGHNAAAFSVRDGLETVSEDVQVEVLDLFHLCYGKMNEIIKTLFLGIVQYAPKLWEGMYSVLDRTSLLEKQMGSFTKLRETLRDIIKTTEPDVVVTTYPAYNYVIDAIYKDHQQRPFKLITIITDSITVNSVWYGAGSDYYVVANGLTADMLLKARVPNKMILTFGFPVSPRFATLAKEQPTDAALTPNTPRRIFYMIHHGKKKAGSIIEQMLKIPNTHLTIACGADAGLKGRLIDRTSRFVDRVRVVGWTNQIPEILAASHVVITKAGGAIVQEALAASCPIIVNQVLPGQEEGNARLIELLGIGGIAADDARLLQLVRSSFESNGELWSKWKKASLQHSRPGASLRIAEFILQECDAGEPATQTRVGGLAPAAKQAPASLFAVVEPKRPLMCDFHTHTVYSDGKLTVSELVDFYGERGFDCLCITDHIAERKRLVGKLSNLSNLTLPWSQMEEYFSVIEAEKKRAWKKYSMILMAGLEFNKDAILGRSSAHLLGIDLKTPISSDLGMKKLIHAIHAQHALAVASHPHETNSTWGRDTLYLWRHQERFAPLIDAWEIANRDDIFNPVGLKRLPFLANSDFHKPSHIYSWKTLLTCEKDPRAIKQCIRENQDISITLYRDASTMARAHQKPAPVIESALSMLNRGVEQLQLPIQRPDCGRILTLPPSENGWAL